MHAATKKYVDTAALPVISGESSATDMDSIIKSGKHMALYYTDGNTLGTPYKYGAVPANYRRAAILSYSGLANYGFQIAIPNGLPYLLMRRLDNGKFYMPDGVTEDPKGNWSKLYSEINPPALADIGAAPAYTYGTEDIAEGSASTAPEGALHFIYEA